MSKTIAFDLDGTLVNSLNGLNQALNPIMEELQLVPFIDSEITNFIGNGIPRFIKDALAFRNYHPSQQDFNIIVEKYNELYNVMSQNGTVLYDGVLETLQYLDEKNYKIVLVTNKSQVPALIIAEELKIDKYFDAILGGDVLPNNVRKPNPEHLLTAIRLVGGDEENSFMVGDHANDILVTVGTKVKPIFCTYGFSSSPPEGIDIYLTLSKISDIKSHF